MTPVCLIGIASCFAMIGVCTALALEGGANLLTVVTARACGTVALLLAYFQVARVPIVLHWHDRVTALAIGIPLTLYVYLFSAAIDRIPVPLAVLIFYLWPIITSAASWVLGHDRFGWRKGFGLVLGFSGVALALNVEFDIRQADGIAMAIGAALAWSLTFLLFSQFARGGDSRAPTLYMTVTSSAGFLAMMLVTRDVLLPNSVAGWFGMVGVALFYSIGMLGLFSASARVGPVHTSFYMNFEPVAAVLLAAAVLGQTLTTVQMVGAALIVCAVFSFHRAGSRSG